MAVVTIHSDFGAQEYKVSHHFHYFPTYLTWNDGTRCHLVFWMLSFKPTFSLSSFTFIKMLLSSSSLYAKRVISSAYLRLLIFLLAILTPACASSSPAFLMMYCDKHTDNIQPWRTPFPLWNQSVVPCPVLTVASRSVYRFSREKCVVLSHSVCGSLLQQQQETNTMTLGKKKKNQQVQRS